MTIWISAEATAGRRIPQLACRLFGHCLSDVEVLAMCSADRADSLSVNAANSQPAPFPHRMLNHAGSGAGWTSQGLPRHARCPQLQLPTPSDCIPPWIRGPDGGTARERWRRPLGELRNHRVKGLEPCCDGATLFAVQVERETDLGLFGRALMASPTTAGVCLVPRPLARRPRIHPCAQRAREGLEGRLDNMVRILAANLHHSQRGVEPLCEGAPEAGEQLKAAPARSAARAPPYCPRWAGAQPRPDPRRAAPESALPEARPAGVRAWCAAQHPEPHPLPRSARLPAARPSRTARVTRVDTSSLAPSGRRWRSRRGRGQAVHER
eukprot:scaffold17629_cov34-Tisochrysis_lutea.AAC.2